MVPTPRDPAGDLTVASNDDEQPGVIERRRSDMSACAARTEVAKLAIAGVQEREVFLNLWRKPTFKVSLATVTPALVPADAAE